MAHLSHMTSMSRNKLKAAEEALTRLYLLKKAPRGLCWISCDTQVVYSKCSVTWSTGYLHMCQFTALSLFEPVITQWQVQKNKITSVTLNCFHGKTFLLPSVIFSPCCHWEHHSVRVFSLCLCGSLRLTTYKHLEYDPPVFQWVYTLPQISTARYNHASVIQSSTVVCKCEAWAVNFELVSVNCKERSRRLWRNVKDLLAHSGNMSHMNWTTSSNT